MQAHNQWVGNMVLIGDFPGPEGKFLKFWTPSGWGRLVEAERYTYAPEHPPQGAFTMEFVRASDPFSGRWGFNFANRSDLMRIEDFEDFEGDEYGNPLVQILEYVCPDCGTVFLRKTSHLKQGLCPECLIKVAPHEVTWCGPDNPVLERLWSRLPLAIRG